jgi:predicted permease
VSLGWPPELLRDVRFGIRQLIAAPAFACLAVTTLALGIGAVTAMLSVVDAVLLRPLPFRAPEQLAMVWAGEPGRQGRPPYAVVEDWRRRSRSFEDLAVFDPAAVTLSTSDGAERIGVVRASPSLFSLLGVRPLHGRLFTNEDAAARRRVALIGQRFWRSRFGGSPEAIGASLVLDGMPSDIIGVLPEGLGAPGLGADVWEPHTLFADWETRRSARDTGSWFVVGRLRPGVTAAQAQDEMSGIARALDAALPQAQRTGGASVEPLDRYVVGERPRLALWLLTGAVLCLLLIAAANVTGLVFARGVGRARELAIRSAMGATPGRIVRQLLAESIVLTAIAGAIGAYLAAAAVRAVQALGPVDLPRLDDVSLNLRVLGWVVSASALTAILVGLAPALARRHSRLSREEGVRGMSSGQAARGVRSGLVVAEFALAIVLLASAGLLVRSWLILERVDPGFNPARILSMQLSTTAFDGSAARTSFYERALEQVRAVPGVESAGIISDLFVGSDAERLVTTDAAGGAVSRRVRLRADEASADVFRTVGTPLLSGRFFSADDRADSPPVAIVNEAMAARLWPGRDPLGKRFKFGPADADNPWLTVVGVIADMRRQGLEVEPIPQVFEATAQNPPRLATLLARTRHADPLTSVAGVQSAVRRVDRSVPLYGLTTLELRLGASLTERRLQTMLIIWLSGLALMMAAIGIYGLIHYSVAARTQEIGIRAAIGAQARDILGMMVREGLQLALAGLALGLAGALVVGRVGASLLFGVTATDPLTFAAVSAILVLVAGAACYLPARRATRIAPVVALQRQ